MSKRKKTVHSGSAKRRRLSDQMGQMIRQVWTDKHPILKFLGGFLLSMALFYLFYLSSFYKNYLEVPLLSAQAHISSFLLKWLGYDTSVQNTFLSGKEFSVNILNGCDGLEAMAIYVSGILIFPVSFRLKWPAILQGLIILLMLNILRIALLYLAGVYFSSEVFEVFHIQGGFILFTMVSVALWLNWVNKTLQRIKPMPGS